MNHIKTFFKKNKYSSGLTIFFIIVITAVINNFLLSLPLFSAAGDAQKYNGYQAYIVSYSLKHFSQFALWDNFLSSGMSWISHPGGGLLSPTAWIVTFFTHDITKGSLLIFYIHTFSASLAFYYLCTVLGFKKITSFLISILVLSNQYVFLFIVNGWFEEFFGLTIIPLTVAFLLIALKRKNYFYATLGAIATAFNFFSNSYYVFHYNTIVLLWIGLFFFAYEILKFTKDKNKKIDKIISVIFLNAYFWIVSMGISAIKLLPLLEFREISARYNLPLSLVENPSSVMTFSFFKSLFLNFIVPGGHTDSFTHWTNSLGIFFLFTSIIYFLFKKSFYYGLFLGLFILGMWGYFAFRMPFDLYAFFYNFLPGFDSNNYPYRFIIVIFFAFIICVGLGLDLLVRQKNRVISLLGIILGAIMVLGAVKYITLSYSTVSYKPSIDIEKGLKTSSLAFRKASDLAVPPEAQGSSSGELFVDLSQLKKVYKNEGRVYATSSNNNSLNHDVIIKGEIESIQHSYDPIVPTYEYAIVLRPNPVDDLTKTKNRFKIFSILNTRFQVQNRDAFEYWGCEGLYSSSLEMHSNLESVKALSSDVCKFLERRLTPLVENKTGVLFYDNKVLPKVKVIPNSILLITDNRFKDYSGFIAKEILFHPDFDIDNLTIVSGGSEYLDDYSLEELKKFGGVILVDPKIINSKKIEALEKEYEGSGGKIINLHSSWIYYESLHNRSASLWTDKPAWNYSNEDARNLSQFFRLINSRKDLSKIEIVKFTPEDVVLTVNTQNDNSVLQYSNSFYPGWKATIDGKDTQVFMADGLVKGVVISKAGKHTVRFYYDPDSYKLGAIISLGTLILILAIYFNKIKRSFAK